MIGSYVIKELKGHNPFHTTLLEWFPVLIDNYSASSLQQYSLAYLERYRFFFWIISGEQSFINSLKIV